MLKENQYIKVKWKGNNKDYYESLGYTFTKFNEEFLVKAEDLPNGSHQKVEVVCDFCGDVIEKEYREYLRNHKGGDCCKKCQGKKALKTFNESLTEGKNRKDILKQGIIDKDLECEHKFEEATNYLFEKILKNKPLMLKGTEHADGMLSFGNKLILWDNKSKETPVKLSDHIKQFDRYIKGEEKSIPVFIVIGPDFTDDSPKECLKYSMSNDTNILLITASELKMVAEKWKENHCDDDEVFPLGYFKQSGRFDISLISFS